MTKQEIHAALKAAGVKLKGINFYKAEDLAALYAEHLNKQLEETANAALKTPSASSSEPAPAEKEKAAAPQAHVLFFTSSGWCEELKRSYFQGVFHPSSVKEYLALRKFAAREGAPI